MKVLSCVLWIVLGVILGLLGRPLVNPSSGSKQPAAGSPTVLTLARQDTRNPLYATLPMLPPKLGAIEATQRLRDSRRANSPARQRADLTRWLIDLAADPSKTAILVEQLQNDATEANNNVGIIGSIFKQWASRDPKSAMDALATLQPHQLQYSAMRSALKTWVGADPDAALAYIKASDLDILADKGLSFALHTLAESDPQAAFTAAQELGDQSLEQSIHHQLIAKKAATDMDSAWAEIDQLSDPDFQLQLRHSAIEGLANHDKAAALRYAEKLSDADQRSHQVRSIFRDWPLSNVDEATAAFLDYPSEALTDGAAFDFGQTMNLADSQRALTFSQSLTGEVRDDYLLGVLTEQAIKQPAKTSVIVTNYFSDEKHLGQIYERLGESWGGKDEHAAAQWLTELPISASRDQAISSFAKKLATMDPERALQWAGTISDPEQRTKRMDKLVAQWRAKDPKAAEAWTQESFDAE